MDELQSLADLIKQRNAVAEEIAHLVGRPAQIGHLGEFVASRVFNIALLSSAAAKGIDGHFKEGHVAGCSVNIKWHTKHDGLLAITSRFLPDFYLVMTGPKVGAISSRGQTRPWVIEFVFLFEAAQLVIQLKQRGVKINEATSIIQQIWQEAEIYPQQRNPKYLLSKEQVRLLDLFRQS